MPNFSGLWTITQQMQAKGASTWPATPGAPTIGTATAGSSACASITFCAPASTGYPAGVTNYRVISTPGCFSNTWPTSPVVVSGLSAGTSYTFKAQATNTTGYGPSSAASNSITAAVQGQQAYTTIGSYTWVAPAGVTSVSVVAVGPGGRSTSFYGSFPSDPGLGGGGGGALAYSNNISVTPGASYSVTVGDCGTSTASSTPCSAKSRFACTVIANGGRRSTSTGNGGVGGGAGGAVAAGTGYSGGNGGAGQGGPLSSSYKYFGGGGGAGGYSGAGGNGAGVYGCNGAAGTGGSGGGGGAGQNAQGAGGGVGILGQGGNGTGGTSMNGGGCPAINGGPGSGGSGALYGGGRGGADAYCGTGGRGAVRIIWPGTTRQFPSTNTADV